MEEMSCEHFTASKRQNLRKSMEKLKAEAPEMLIRIPQLKGLLEYNEMVEADIEERSRELDLKEKELLSLRLDLEQKRKIFEEEKAEAGDLKELVEECTEELRLKRNELKTELTNTQRELEVKNKQLRNVMADISRSNIEARHVENRKREIEEETDRKMKELSLILDKVKESGKQFVTVDEQLEFGRRQLELQSMELASKEKELGYLRESIMVSSSDVVLKEKKLETLNNCIAVCSREIDSKSEELGKIQKLIEQQTYERDSIKRFIQELSEELVGKEKRHEEILEVISRRSSEMEEKLHKLKTEMGKERSRKNKDLVEINSKIEESGKQLKELDELVESQRSLLELQSKELVSKDMELECVAESRKRFEFGLEVKEKRFQALNDLITISGDQLDRKSKELGEIQKLIAQQTNEIGDMLKRRNLMKILKKELAEKLVVKEKQLKEILEAISRSSSEMESTKTEASDLHIKSQRFRRDIEDRVKELDKLKNQIKSGEKELIQLRKSIQDCKTELRSRKDQVEAMKKSEREVELNKQLRQTHEQQPASTPINGNDTSQQTNPDIGDVLTLPEISTVLKRKKFSSVLRDSPNPAEYVLELVQRNIREELDLHDSLVKNLILLFEEFARIQRSDDSQVQNNARQVATLWKRKISIEAPKSSLEVLAFLLFIVIYGLKSLINEEETALLASSIARHEQAPDLFDSLSLKCDIREFVKGCIEKSQYIPAVRLICLFDLNTELSPSELLMKEIINLRQSSQGQDKDAGKLRAVLELIAAYNLEIDLPGDLVAKLVVQREYSTPPVVQCTVKYGNSSANPQQANSPNLASSSASPQLSSVNLLVPKLEVKPELNP